MKISFLLLTMFFATAFVHAADISPVSAAFKNGNAAQLTPYFDTEVDMAISGTASKCNAEKATAMLATFFAANKPASFTIAHNADKKDTGFLVGKLTAGKSEYRVNVSYRIDGGKAIIQSIRIE
jgi:hypothetical protein